MSLPLKYRPTVLKNIVGQTDAVTKLLAFRKKKQIPHCMLFAGPAGCGKTTMARIMAKYVGCDISSNDLREMNAANSRGIEAARDIEKTAILSPMMSKSRVWIVDEAHQLTKDAQSALLKIFEEPPNHAYFFLATTDPNKLLDTIRSRATRINLKLLARPDIESLVERVCEKEGIDLDEEVFDKIVSEAEGSPRQALVLLDSIVGINGSEEQLQALEPAEIQKQSIDLCRALANSKMAWPKIAAIVKGIEDDPERVRRAVLGYAGNVLLGSKGQKAEYFGFIIESFRDNYFDCGKAGLINSAYEVVKARS